MNPSELQSLLPFLVIAAGSLLVTLAISVRRSQTLTAMLACAALLIALICLPVSKRSDARLLKPLLSIDDFGLYYTGLIFFASLIVAVLSYNYFKKHDLRREEFYILLLLSALGASVLTVSIHFISLFLGLELLSVSLYVMIGYLYKRETALEAAVKYLILAAATSAFLLFGMALIYARGGTMAFVEIAEHVLSAKGYDLYLLAGAGLIFVGAGFKLSVVPFHQWTPDVYQGAPAPVTAFLATVSKGSMVALVLRLFSESGVHHYPGTLSAITVVAIASMAFGNILALFQQNIKRLLAYSSIAHMGYLLVAFIASGDLGREAATFYITAYVITMLGAFGVVGHLSTGERDFEKLSDYRGLFWQRSGMAAVFSLMLFSLIGLPLTAGFMGKLFIFSAGIYDDQWFLVLWLALSSAVGLYYYLRVVITMYTPSSSTRATGQSAPSVKVTMVGTTLTLLAVLVVWLGVYPASVMEWIRVLSFIP